MKVEIIQSGLKECGSACLCSIIRYYGGNVPIQKIMELTNTTKEGTSFYNIKEAALEIGMSAKAYQLKDVTKLKEINKPFISQVVINNYLHFIVVYKIDSKRVTIMDPANGMDTIKINEYLEMWTGYILILEPYKMLPLLEETNYFKSIIVDLLYRNIKLIINIGFLSLIITIFTYIYSYFFKIIIDEVGISNKNNLLIICLIFLIIALIKITANYLRTNLLLYLNQKIDLSIVIETIKKVLLLPLNYYKVKTTGEVIARINDVLYLKEVVSKVIIYVFGDLILSLGALIVLFSINMKMTFILLIIVTIYFLLFLIYKPLIKRMTNINQENNARFKMELVEAISGYETIKNLNLENSFRQKIDRSYLEVTKNSKLFLKWLNFGEFLKDISQYFLILTIIYIGVISIYHNELSIGSLITYNTILYYFLNPIRNVFNLYNDLYFSKNSISRINELLDCKSEEFTESKYLLMNGGIYFKHLSFSFDKCSSIINDFTINILPSEKVIVLGESGAGKSTVLKLLYQYYKVERNMLFINGIDINDFSLSDIRNNIAYFSQNEFLYSDTIRNNILLNREVTEDKFLKICHITHVSDIVCKWQLGYNYRLEENGFNLSGGERKRIMLARLLLKEADIFLIDEGFNEIDITMERDILINIFKYFPKKIFIVVSHRTNNMDLFSKVIKLKKGKLVEGLNRYV